jgi:hypothetical protein
VYRNAVTIPALPGSKTFHCKVLAIAWGGTRWNDGSASTFTTPPLRPLPGVTFVSDIEWENSSAGAGNAVLRDKNYHGNPIAIAGKTYPKGVWTHAFNDATPADIVIGISGRNFGTFVADAGVEDSAGNGSVQFQVLVDGELKSESPVMKSGGAHHFDVPVAHARKVTLRVLNGGDGFSCDHAAWGGARFIEAGQRDPLLEVF